MLGQRLCSFLVIIPRIIPRVVIPQLKAKHYQDKNYKEGNPTKNPVHDFSSFLLMSLCFYNIFVSFFCVFKSSWSIFVNVFEICSLLMNFDIDLFCNTIYIVHQDFYIVKVLLTLFDYVRHVISLPLNLQLFRVDLLLQLTRLWHRLVKSRFWYDPIEYIQKSIYQLTSAFASLPSRWTISFSSKCLCIRVRISPQSLPMWPYKSHTFRLFSSTPIFSKDKLTYLLIIGDTDVAVFMYFFTQQGNFITALLHLFVYGISHITVILLAAN